MTASDEPLLLVDTDGAVVTLTLNRPRQLNALSIELRRLIVSEIRRLSSQDEIRAIILTGAGRAFTAGVDLKEAGREGFSLGVGSAAGSEIDMAKAFAACPWPVIGAINGFAITGGFELALMCDILLASTEAKFADTHGRVGLMPVWGLSQKLPRLIGPGRAKELSLTGNFLGAEQAERWGLVNRVCEPAVLLPEARRLAQEMASLPPALLKSLKSLIDDGASLNLPDALAMEIARGTAHNRAVTPDAAESSRREVMKRGREQTG